MSVATLNPKQLNAAVNAAHALCHKIRTANGQSKIKFWSDLESFGLQVDGLDYSKLRSTPIPAGHFYILVEPLLKRYLDETPARLQAALDTPAERRKLKLADESTCRKLGKYQLFREQEPVVSSVISYFYTQEDPGRLALIPAGTGAGKTQIALGVVDYVLKQNLHNKLGIPFPYPIIWLTVKNAVHQTKQRIIDCGLGDHLDKEIFVWPYSALTSSFGKERLLTEVTLTDPHTGEESIAFEYKPFALASLLILDECHALAREDSQRTKAIKAYDLAARAFPVLPTKIIAMSATPAERVNDGRVITCMANITYDNVPITWDNFNVSFAQLLSAEPNVASKASVTRLFNAWREIVFEPPYIRWPFKSINACRLYDFRNQADRDYVDAAMERYLDKISQLGRDTPSDLALQRIALLQLRKSLEPSRSELMVDDMRAEVAKGNTAICGTAFTGTIIRSVFYLQDTYNTPRDQISIIWGGRKDPRPEKILTAAELIELACSEDMSPKTLRLLQQQLDWQEDKLLFGDESLEDQDARHARLKSLGLLGVQTQEKRQLEIDKFMSGQARYCFFTMASGGTGLSLEHCDDRQAPRVGFYTPIYNAKEWVQALGRPHRRNSISDTRQYICLLADTIEQTHVAPNLDRKLQSLGAGFSVTSKDDVFSALLNLSAAELRRKVIVNIRNETQATLDAENEDTQLRVVDINDEEDDE